jgi:cytochrome P450
MQRRFGDTYTLRVTPIGKLVVVCRPEDVRKVALGHPGTFPVGENNALFMPLLGERSVIALDGAEHRAERKKMHPPLHGDRLARAVSVMEQLTEDEVSTWPNGELTLIDSMRRLTLRVISRVVLGIDEGHELHTSMREVINFQVRDLLAWIWPQLTHLRPWRRTTESIDHNDDLLYEEIARRRQDPTRVERPDVLSMLIDSGPNDELIRVELLAMLIGGFETTAVQAAWMFERLVRHPEALARVREGLSEPEDDYRTAVVKESLRLRQVGYNIGRRITEPVELGGYRLPAGTFIWPSLGAVHTDPRVWGDDAEEFRPERWLSPDVPVHAFLPFGGGVHRCLGAAFAQVELEVILRNVLRHADLAPDRPEAEPAVMRNVVMAPKRGARVLVTRRP